MIYQNNDQFLVFPYKAKYGQKEQFVVDKERFEEDLLFILKIDDENAVLPDISYENISLTPEQASRYEEIKNIKGLQLDEVRDYVVDGTLVNSPYYLALSNSNYLLDLEFRISMIELNSL